MDVAIQIHSYITGVLRYFGIYSKLGAAKAALEQAEFGLRCAMLQVNQS